MLAKNYHLQWISDRANIPCKYFVYIFSIFGVFLRSISMLFPEAPASSNKEILKQFLLHSTSICISSKSVSQIFKSCFKLEILIMLSFVVSFLVDMFNLKAPFLTKTTSETHFIRGTIKKY